MTLGRQYSWSAWHVFLYWNHAPLCGTEIWLSQCSERRRLTLATARKLRVRMCRRCLRSLELHGEIAEALQGRLPLEVET